MRLLFITQKADLDDDVLGVYHHWIAGVAPSFEHVSVICLYKGVTALPANVTVYSLGKEGLAAGRHRLLYSLRFLALAWRLRNHYDAVFVHMNPEYLLLAGWLWKLLGKRTVFWYAHYLATAKLRIAAFFASTIVTSTRLAYPLASNKLVVLQQGIDIEKFKPQSGRTAKNDAINILWVGRMTPVKNIEVLLHALAALPNVPVHLDIVGGPTPGQALEEGYYQSIRTLALSPALRSRVQLLPPIPHRELPSVYPRYDLFVNLTTTGSFDKTTLEAMASGVPVIVSNRAFLDLFTELLQQHLVYKEKDAADLAGKLKQFALLSAEQRATLGKTMRQLIVEHHALPKLVARLAAVLQH